MRRQNNFLSDKSDMKVILVALRETQERSPQTDNAQVRNATRGQIFVKQFRFQNKLRKIT